MKSNPNVSWASLPTSSTRKSASASANAGGASGEEARSDSVEESEESEGDELLRQSGALLAGSGDDGSSSGRPLPPSSLRVTRCKDGNRAEPCRVSDIVSVKSSL